MCQNYSENSNYKCKINVVVFVVQFTMAVQTRLLRAISHHIYNAWWTAKTKLSKKGVNVLRICKSLIVIYVNYFISTTARIFEASSILFTCNTVLIRLAYRMQKLKTKTNINDQRLSINILLNIFHQVQSSLLNCCA